MQASASATPFPQQFLNLLLLKKLLLIPLQNSTYLGRSLFGFKGMKTRAAVDSNLKVIRRWFPAGNCILQPPRQSSLRILSGLRRMALRFF